MDLNRWVLELWWFAFAWYGQVDLFGDLIGQSMKGQGGSQADHTVRDAQLHFEQLFMLEGVAALQAVQAALQAFGTAFAHELAEQVRVESGGGRGLPGEQTVVLLEEVFELVGVRLLFHVLMAD